MKGQNKEDVDKDYLEIMYYNFKHAIENKMDMVYMGFVILDEETTEDIWVEKKDWVKALDILINESSILEEYEYAIDFKKMKECLSLR